MQKNKNRPKPKNLNRSRMIYRATDYIYRALNSRGVVGVKTVPCLGTSDFRVLAKNHFSDLPLVPNETQLSFFVRCLAGGYYEHAELEALRKLIAFFEGDKRLEWSDPFSDEDKSALRQAFRMYGWKWSDLEKNIQSYGDLPF